MLVSGIMPVQAVRFRRMPGINFQQSHRNESEKLERLSAAFEKLSKKNPALVRIGPLPGFHPAQVAPLLPPQLGAVVL
jgi:hypothetical protein